MTSYLIAYDLTGPNLKYAEMIKRLRRLEPERPIESLLGNLAGLPDSTYILNTSTTAREILDALKAPGGLDENDKVLIATIAGDIVQHPAK